MLSFLGYISIKVIFSSPGLVVMVILHIDTGRPYTEQVKRIITGSVGFDDYEWGVSLFCDDALQFKKLIYATRFDEVSTVYGIFGSFYIGNLLKTDRIHQFFQIQFSFKY